jgi:tight adherence protein C
MYSVSIIVALVGICGSLLTWAVLATFLSEERAVAQRLRAMSSSEYAHAGEVNALARPFTERVLGAAAMKVAARVRSLMPSAYGQRLQARIRMAGPRSALTADSFILIKMLSGAAGLALGLFVAGVSGLGPVLKIAVASLGACVGIFGPDFWLSQRITARQTAIRLALPDTLDMLMVSVEAGLGFDASLGKVVSSTQGPLPEEFSVALQEIQAGISRRDALQHLLTRTGVSELSAFVMAIIQAETLGVSITNVLRQQAKEMRVKRRQRAEELAQAAPAKMVFPIILCILPATLIVVGAPAVIRVARIFGASL